MIKRTASGPVESAQKASVACLKRLPSYLQLLREMQKHGQEFVSGTVLSSVHSLEPVIVRKDLAITGVVGRPKLGFRIDELIHAIERFLGWDRPTEAVLVGCGSLGTALLGYGRFSGLRLKVVGAFDRDSRKTGRVVHGVKIGAMDTMASFAAHRNIALGLLTTPAESAQEVADQMVECGIRGIWNFAPVKLNVPPHVVVQKEDIAEGLAVLLHRMRQAHADAIAD
ncbi:MAG TPA: redox-sensing transcriptional repressor Rex [Verrucomicrobiae bacterium]|nr:redox-sensing transcriptional repressor Rex [Verrucomicrobiae bacterium]